MWQKRHNGYFEVRVFRPCVASCAVRAHIQTDCPHLCVHPENAAAAPSRRAISRKRAVPSRAEDASDTESPRASHDARTHAAHARRHRARSDEDAADDHRLLFPPLRRRNSYLCLYLYIKISTQDL